MGKTLIVAEKPSVGRDIARVLGSNIKNEGVIEGGDYVVTWAFGHLVTLCEPDEINPALKKWRRGDLPILPESIPIKVIAKTKAQFNLIKKQMNSPDTERIICATDSGREGELIFRLIYMAAGCKKPVSRLWISSMTDEAIRAGLKALKPASHYDPLYMSARLRSEADWLIGMNATRAFTLQYGVLLSVGRVQTPTLNIIVSRDREIAAFAPRDYWDIQADFGDYAGLWLDPESNETRCYDQERAREIKAKVAGGTGTVVTSEREVKRMPPPQLYDLTALQRDANQLMGLTAAKSLKLAQSLYETYKLITYPRTDSRYLPRDMIPSVKSAVAGLPGEYAPLAAPLLENLPIPPRVYNDAKVTDHHAIITTDKRPLANLPEPERKLYGLVAKRLLAAHYPDYQYESAKVITRVKGHDFLSNGATPLIEGWRAVYRDEPSKGDAPLPRLETGDERLVKAVTIKKNKTKPPDRLTDATLLRAMEAAGRELADDELRESMKDSGLGTPATRAAIIERLIDVGYVARSGKSLLSTDKGGKLISIVPDEMRSPEMTGRWEKALTGIAKATDAEALGAQKGRFADGIRRFASFIVDAAFAAPIKITFEPDKYKRSRSK